MNGRSCTLLTQRHPRTRGDPSPSHLHTGAVNRGSSPAVGASSLLLLQVLRQTVGVGGVDDLVVSEAQAGEPVDDRLFQFGSCLARLQDVPSVDVVAQSWRERWQGWVLCDARR